MQKRDSGRTGAECSDFSILSSPLYVMVTSNKVGICSILQEGAKSVREGGQMRVARWGKLNES